MKNPEFPPAGQVLVLRNSFFKEWKPEYVEDTFDSAKEAETWIKAKLDEEPGDLYVIVHISKIFWAQVEIHNAARRLPKAR